MVGEGMLQGGVVKIAMDKDKKELVFDIKKKGAKRKAAPRKKVTRKNTAVAA